MPDPLQDIHSGDVITATWFNEVLSELRTLRATVQLLQQSSTASNALQLSGFDRSSARVNEFLTIVGRNFAFPWTGNTVTFDGTPAQITGGTSVELRVRVPDPGTLGSSGRSVTVSVTITGTNQRGSMQFFVEPASSTTPVPTFAPIQSTLSFLDASSVVTLTITGTNLAGTSTQVRFTPVPTGPAILITPSAGAVTPTQIVVSLAATLFVVGNRTFDFDIVVDGVAANPQRITVNRLS